MEKSNTTTTTGTQPDTTTQPPTFADIVRVSGQRDWLASNGQELRQQIARLRQERTANTVSIAMNTITGRSN